MGNTTAEMSGDGKAATREEREVSREQGYDFFLGGQRLFSATTQPRESGIHAILLHGLETDSEGATHQYVYCETDGQEVVGGTCLKSRGQHVGSGQSLSTETAPLVARFEATYDAAEQRYSARLTDWLPGSTVSSAPWKALDYSRRSAIDLPGKFGQSGFYDVRLIPRERLAGVSASSHAAIVPFSQADPLAMCIDWSPRSSTASG